LYMLVTLSVTYALKVPSCTENLYQMIAATERIDSQHKPASCRRAWDNLPESTWRQYDLLYLNTRVKQSQLRIAPSSRSANEYGCQNWKMSRSNQPIVHVALVGNTGVGKSTLVNVLKGREIAEVNNNVRPCTTRTMKYEVVEGDTTYCIWDTRGLNEGSEKAALATRMLKRARILPDPERELKNFLRGKDPRVNLVLLCIDAKKIRVNVHWKIYNKIYADFCERGLKVAVVVTQMGERDFRSSEWKGKCKLTATGVVEEFPDARMMEAVPQFEELNDPSVEDCRGRILRLISNAVEDGPSRAGSSITDK